MTGCGDDFGDAADDAAADDDGRMTMMTMVAAAVVMFFVMMLYILYRASVLRIIQEVIIIEYSLAIYSLLLNMAIETVSFPIIGMMIFPPVFFW